MNFETMECSMNYTHDCSILLSSVVMTMLVFMISTFMIISSYVSKKNEMKEIQLPTDGSDETLLNYDTDTETESSCDDSEKVEQQTIEPRRRTNRYRDMGFLTHGQKIRYVYENRECLGMYNSKTRMFINEKGKSFETPSAFARNHLLEMKMNGKMKSGRETFQVNGWTDCECEINGVWVTLDEYVHNLKKFLFRF
jgi:hypothetical protein